MEKETTTPHEDELGVETEVGATRGSTHARVLEQTLGRERGQKNASWRGPPKPKR